MIDPHLEEIEEGGLEEQAASWFLRIRNASDSDRMSLSRELSAWLAEDDARRHAYKNVEYAWLTVAAHGNAPEIMVKRHRALGRVRDTMLSRWGMSRGPRALVAAIALLIVTAAGLGVIFSQMSEAVSYETGAGERRDLILPDGSRVALDGQTKVIVDYTRDGRNLNLLKGQARFQVAKDRARPFRVTAANQTVVALGTDFNVDLLGDRVLVTLVEGHVAVENVRPALQIGPEKFIEHDLNPGQQLVARRDGATEIRRHINVESALAWRSGKLVLKDEPLYLAIQRINRQSNRPISVEGDTVARLSVSGVFEAGDVDAFVDAIEHYYPVRVTRNGDGSIQLQAQR